MDSQIYGLLARAELEKSGEYVRKAYEILDPDLDENVMQQQQRQSIDLTTKPKPITITSDVDNFSQSLYVECAEKAIKYNEFKIANRCLKIYFTLPTIANQFLARAYICQFELLAPKRTDQLENLEKSIPYLYKAIEFAKQNNRYYFLVYNSSVVYWKYTRIFLKPRFKRHLINSLRVITKSLKEIEDADYEWRAFLERTLIEAYLDNQQSNEASALTSDLLKFIRTYVPASFDEFFEFINSKSLLSDEEIKAIISSRWDLHAIYLIERLKKNLNSSSSSSKTKRTNANAAANAMLGAAKSETESLNSFHNASNSDDSVANELENIYKLLLLPTSGRHTSSLTDSSEFMKSSLSQNGVISSNNKKEELFKRYRLMLNLASVCLLHDEVNLCSQILGYLKEAEQMSEELSIELEFIECDQNIKELKHKQEKYTKGIVKYRIECLNRCTEQLRNALRLNTPKLVQLGCLTIWNICLPLLQPGLRNEARKSLQFASECLESIESMECLLRCQIHFELAKCDEEIEQLQTAQQHLKKALLFDDENIYREQLLHQLKRLELRAELYKTPERKEDQAAMILEQCVIGGQLRDRKLKPALSDLVKVKGEKANGGGNEINTHSLLLRVGDLLAPNDFTHVLESETFKADFGKLGEDEVSKLAKKVNNYEECIKKADNHLIERLSDLEREFRRKKERSSSTVSATSGGPAIAGNAAAAAAESNDDLEKLLKAEYKERLKLWIDLCKIARKQKIWDICRVSCRFCLLYDKDELINRFLKKSSSTVASATSSTTHQQHGHHHNSKKQNNSESFGNLFEKELIRNLAEVHFIFAESLIQYIRGESIELFEKPKLPDDALEQQQQQQQNDSDDQRRDFSTDSEWLLYNEWLSKLCTEAVQHFLKGIQMGATLNESWLVSQGSAYLWNYFHHLFEKRKHSQVNATLTHALDALRKIGHNNEPELLVFISVALATGLMMPWLPPEQVKQLQIPSNIEGSSHHSNQLSSEQHNAAAGKGANKSPSRKGGGGQGNAPAASKGFSIPSEASADIKKALEICENAMNVTNGDNPADMISLKHRFDLIRTWVLSKQINQSPIKNLSGTNVKTNNVERKQDKYTRCMVGIEILNRNAKLVGLSGASAFEIKDAPSIKDMINLIEHVENWPDKLVELQLWSNLAVLAARTSQTDNLRYIHSKALGLVSFFEKHKTDNKGTYLTAQILFSEACIALGEHLSSIVLMTTNQSTSTTTSSNNKQPATATNHQQANQNAKLENVSSFDFRVTLRRDALNAFADAAGFAAKGESYEYASHSARHYWNLCLPYLKQPQERATLYDNLNEILAGLQATFKYNAKDFASKSKLFKTALEEGENKKDETVAVAAGKAAKNKEPKESKQQIKKDDPKQQSKTSMKALETTATTEQQQQQPAAAVTAGGTAAFNPLEDAFDDLTLRSVLYACLFQILIDRNQYNEALDQMEKALNDLPRTKHRLLIYRFKVITKSKLGMDVQMDLQKFKEESEKNLAQMYRTVALSSLKDEDTISSYQRAIEALKSEECLWLKFEYIIELAQWLYSNEYNLGDSIALCEWAIDLIVFFNSIKQQQAADKLAAASRALSAATSVATSMSKFSKAKRQNQKNTNNPTNQLQLNTLNILPTIEDVPEVRSLHADMEKVAQSEFESISKNSNEMNNNDDILLFGGIAASESSSSFLMRSIQPTDIQEIRQLACLSRANTILATMSGRNAAEYQDYLLKSYYFAIRVLYQAVENSLGSLKEIQKLMAAQAADDKNKKGAQPDPKRGSSLGSYGGGGAQKKLKIEGGANAYLPQTLEQWSQFELHDEIISSWKHDLMQKTGINEETINEPYLFFYYLDMLANNLSELGLSHLLFPIYNLQLILINSTFNFKDENSTSSQSINRYATLTCYVRMRLLNLCIELNLTQAVIFHEQAIAQLVLTAASNASNAKAAPVGGGGKDQAAQQQDPAATLASVTGPALLSNPASLIKLIQLDPYEVCLVREQIYLQKQRLSNLKDEADITNNNANNNSIQIESSSLNQFKSKQQRKPTFNVNHSAAAAKRSKIVENNEEMAAYPGEKKKIARNITEILYKDAWLMMADLLIQNGYFQNARDFLHESLSAALSFEDKFTVAKIEYFLGMIALYDCNFLEARNYAASALKVALDEQFWYKCIRLQVDSYRLDKHDKESINKCVKLLVKAYELIESKDNRAGNKLGIYSYMKAMLTYQMAKITLEGVMDGRLTDENYQRIGGSSSSSNNSRQSDGGRRLNTMSPYAYKQLSKVCQLYRDSSQLLYIYGYKRESIDIIRAHARLLKQFAKDSHNKEAMRDYFLKSYTVFADACNISNELLVEIQSLTPMNEIQNVSLPVQRELADAKLELADLLLDILEVYLNEITFMNESNLTKDPVLKALSSYISSCVDENNSSNESSENKWRTLLSQAPELVSANLISSLNFSVRIKQLKAKTFYLIGRSLRIISQLKYQTRSVNLSETDRKFSESLNIQKAISAWSPLIAEFIKTQYLSGLEAAEQAKLSKSKQGKYTAPPSALRVDSTPLGGGTVANRPISETALTNAESEKVAEDDPEFVSNLIDLNYLRNLLSTVNSHEAQAMELLLQSLNLAFIMEDKTLMAKIAYEFIELLGCYDPLLNAQFIAFYQSCQNGLRVEQIVKKSSYDPKNSLITGYLHQLNFYRETNVTRNQLNSPVVGKLLEITKNRFNAFNKYLTISNNHFNFSKDLPSNYILLVIQLNQEKNELYATILDRSKPAGGGGQAKLPKGQPVVVLPTLKSLVLKTKYDPARLAHLKAQWKEWKTDLQVFNSKIEFQVNSNEFAAKKEASNLIKQSESTSFKPDLTIKINESEELMYEDSENNFLTKFYMNQLNSKSNDDLIRSYQDFNARFENLIGHTEKFMAQTSELLDNYFKAAQFEQSQQVQLSSKQPAVPPGLVKPSDKLILLADLDLFDFPLEALKIFHNNTNIVSVTRDFSLQFFAARFYGQKELMATETSATKGDDKGKAAPAQKAGGGQKQVNFELNGTTPDPLPECAVMIDHTRFKYLVDPFSESSSGLPAEYHFINAFKKFTQQYSSQITAKWSGLTGSDHASSFGERERLLIESGAFLFSGPERLLSYFNSSKIASFNLTDCRLLIANDLVRTSKSYSRLGKLDVYRHSDELECENSLESAVLLSLTGIKCLMLNQWSSTSIECYEKLRAIFKEFMENRQSAGELIRNKISPHVRQIVLDRIRKEEEKRLQQLEKEKEKKERKPTQKQQQQSESRLNSSTKRSEMSGSVAAAAVGNKASMATTMQGMNQETIPEDAAIYEEAPSIDPKQLEAELEEQRRLVLINQLSRLRKENCNMIVYGLPDVFMTNT